MAAPVYGSESQKEFSAYHWVLLWYLCGCRVITIHNNPENMKLPTRFKHLRFQLADVDTQDVSQFFDASYQFIEEGRGANEGRPSAPTPF